MSKQIRTAAIIGMGSLGILYGQKLAAALGPEGFFFIADPERIARYTAEGVYCNDQPCQFRFVSAPQPGQLAPDLLIFAVKATTLQAAMEQAAPFVGPDTILLSVLNGISSEDILAQRFGREHLLYCVAQGMDATKTGNRLFYGHAGQLCVGYPPEDGDKSEKLAALCALLDAAGVVYTVEDDIRRRLWSKFMLNVGVNQAVMVFEGNYGTVQSEGPARTLMQDAMREVIELAQAAGVGLTQADMDGYVALVDTLSPEGMPSMRQDGLAHRPSEVELFSGTVLRLAQQYGLDLPVNRYLYSRIREMEAAY